MKWPSLITLRLSTIAESWNAPKKIFIFSFLHSNSVILYSDMHSTILLGHFIWSTNTCSLMWRTQWVENNKRWHNQCENYLSYHHILSYPLSQVLNPVLVVCTMTDRQCCMFAVAVLLFKGLFLSRSSALFLQVRSFQTASRKFFLSK